MSTRDHGSAATKWLAVLAALCVAGSETAFAQQSGTITVQAAVAARPDTVRVGDPFVIEVGIRAPRGATIVFPDGPDSTGPIQALDPRRVETRPDSAALVEWAYYRVAAWDIGAQSVALGDVVVRLAGAERRVALGKSSVFVQTVLPADSAQRVPKPPRPLFEFGATPWWLWAAIAAAVLLLLLLLYWWLRRRRRPKPALVVDLYERAEREFKRIEALGLVDAGERGRFVALMVEVVRDYLAARYATARLSHTSTELAAAVRGERALPYERLARLLDETDLIKFARRPVTPERARELGREARAIVAHEHRASQPAPAASEQAA